jgi:signal transduction histidine kinase/CheY-like chemotaxis protein
MNIISFRTKVLVPFVACMVTLMVVTFFVVNHRIKQQVRAEGETSLETAQDEFRHLQKDRTQNFLLRFQDLPGNQPWIALFRANDAKTLQIPLKGLLAEQNVHIVLYTSSNKGVLDCEVRDPLLSDQAFEAAADPAVKLALQGEKKSDTVLVGEQLYDVVCIPVSGPSGDLIGVLTLGSEFGSSVAQEFGQRTHSEVALLADGHVITSTLSGSDASAQFISAFQESLAATGNEDAAAEVRRRIVDGEHYFSAAGRLSSLGGDHALGYVLLNSYEQSLNDAHQTQLVLLGFSFCAILVGAAIIWFLVNKITRPLRELRDSAEAVGRGDFSRRVPVRSRDECGELAVVFNRMTENLQESRAQLEETVETLKNTQEQLIQSEKLSGVGEFVAGVTHELNNPLAAVMGFSEMLKDAEVDAKHRRYLDMIHKSAQRCQKIVQSLLSFARRHQPERKPVSMNSLVETVLEIVQYQLRTGNIEVTTQFDPALPVVFADPHQVQQVLLNVINNARQAIENHQTKGAIKIITESDGENVRVIIHDNGPGIPDENLRRIFDPFFTTKEVGKGTGLGLSLCYGIIREHGGTITPLNRHGEGATFIIELPVMEISGDSAEIPRVAEPVTLDLHEGKGKKILVIDDEEPILQMIRENLLRNGYEADVANDGETGLRQLKQNNYDVVFCDWKMPGLTGRQVYESLRATNPDLCQRVVFITGDVINEPMREFLEKEERLCLAKPFTLGEFRDAIKTVLAAA